MYGNTITSRLLRVAADDLDELARLNDLLAARVAELEDRRKNELRETYRKGYRAGYFTGRQRRPGVTNPERHARGELGAMFR